MPSAGPGGMGAAGPVAEEQVEAAWTAAALVQGLGPVAIEVLAQPATAGRAESPGQCHPAFPASSKA